MRTDRRAQFIPVLIVFLALVADSSPQARTLILDGALTSSFHVKDTAVIGAPTDQGGIEDFTYHLVPPPTAASKTSKQTISNYRHTATPPPNSTKERTDPYGNKILELNWKAPRGEIKIVGEYDVKASVEFVPVASTTSYPIGAVLLSFTFQMATIYIPFLNPVFKTQPLDLDELVISLGLASIIFFAVEIEKWWKRRQRD